MEESLTMRKSTQLGGTLAIGLSLSVAGIAAGQVQVVPPPGPLPAALPGLVERFAERVRVLAEDATVRAGTAPAARTLLPDLQELSQAIAEYQGTLASAQDPFVVRQGYASVDASWHHLQAELGRAAVSAPSLTRDAAAAAAIDGQIHQALGMNPYPVAASAEAPAVVSGLPYIQRLSYALVQRAELVAAAIRADLRGPAGKVPYDASMSLVQVADAFHDGINLNAPIGTAQTGFAGVAAETRQLAEILATAPTTPRIREAWRSYKAAEVLMRKELGLPNSPDDLAGTAIPAAGPSPVVRLSNELVSQTGAFLQVFQQTGGNVPERGLFVADGQRLLAAATKFRDDAARLQDPGRLSFEYREVDACWQRLARRANRIARGRVGPNVEQIGMMGQTLKSLHSVLGLPGYPAVIYNSSPQ